jgi:metacaspase-1
MPVLRWGMRDTPPATDIAALQRVLIDLGYYTGSVDGYFGAPTRSAVIGFQRDNRLVPDGVVGPLTRAALGLAQVTPSPTPTPTPTPIQVRRESLHIGINRVNPAMYGGWSGALNGCEADCDTMTAIATAEGFTTRVLKTTQATSEAILGAINSAAARLSSGDTLMITYAGHGGQVPNADADTDPEADSQDETWVLYDRQLIDDELWNAWRRFAAGVNIVVVSDSCHSGTIARLFLGTTRGVDADEDVDAEIDELQSDTYTVKKSYYLDLAIPRPGIGDPPIAGFPRPGAQARAVPASLAQSVATAGSAPSRYPADGLTSRTALMREGPSEGSSEGVLTREMPWAANAGDVAARGALYMSLQLPNKVTVRSSVLCNVVSCSGCKDNQLSQEVAGHGVFTTTLDRVWAGRTWVGSYEAFLNAITGQMGPTQQPQLGRYGANVDQFVATTPFGR